MSSSRAIVAADSAASSYSVKTGILKKRNGRLHRWSTRYFTLTKGRLSYKVKEDSPTNKGEFDLIPGCYVSEISEDIMRGAIKGKKIFSFWVVWPDANPQKNTDGKSSSVVTTASTAADESDDDEIEGNNNGSNTSNKKDLKQIIESEVANLKQKEKKVEEQIEKHQTYDKNVSLGVKVAAVALGGVVLGALTAGVGLVPYITVVGITAVAGGGAVALQFRKPLDGRLIIACDTMQEAQDWRSAIEREISAREIVRKPVLPPSADPQVISSIIGMSVGTAVGAWRRVRVVEGMRILEQTNPSAGIVCRKAQLLVRSTPINTFLALMEESKAFWPPRDCGGEMLGVVKSIDEHADIIGATVGRRKKGKGKGSVRELFLSRFWKLDDDGIYLITLNSTDPPPAPAGHHSTSAAAAAAAAVASKPPGGSAKASDSGVSGGNNSSKMKQDNDAGSEKHKGNQEGKGGGGNAPVNQQNQNNNKSGGGEGGGKGKVSLDAVITISPRKDHAEYDDDLAESLVCITVQVGTDSDWKKGELTAFLDDFLIGHLLELRQWLLFARYGAEKSVVSRAIDESSPLTAFESFPFSEFAAVETTSGLNRVASPLFFSPSNSAKSVLTAPEIGTTTTTNNDHTVTTRDRRSLSSDGIASPPNAAAGSLSVIVPDGTGSSSAPREEFRPLRRSGRFTSGRIPPGIGIATVQPGGAAAAASAVAATPTTAAGAADRTASRFSFHRSNNQGDNRSSASGTATASTATTPTWRTNSGEVSTGPSSSAFKAVTSTISGGSIGTSVDASSSSSSAAAAAAMPPSHDAPVISTLRRKMGIRKSLGSFSPFHLHHDKKVISDPSPSPNPGDPNPYPFLGLSPITGGRKSLLLSPSKTVNSSSTSSRRVIGSASSGDEGWGGVASSRTLHTSSATTASPKRGGGGMLSVDSASAAAISASRTMSPAAVVQGRLVPQTPSNTTTTSGATSSSSSKYSSYTSMLRRRRRANLSPEVETEASVLRGQIAAKEYEVERLNRELREKEKEKRESDIAAGAGGSGGVSVGGGGGGKKAANKSSGGKVVRESPTAMILGGSSASSSTGGGGVGVGSGGLSFSARAMAPPLALLPLTDFGVAASTAAVQKQLEELNKLKSYYQTLTGTPYDQSTTRRRGGGALNRLRTLSTAAGGSSSSSTAHSSSSYYSSSIANYPYSLMAQQSKARGGGSGSGGYGQRSLPADSPDGSTGSRTSERANRPRPRVPKHWIASQSQRIDSLQHSERIKSESSMNILLVTMFAVCMISTIFLANLLSKLF